MTVAVERGPPVFCAEAMSPTDDDCWPYRPEASSMRSADSNSFDLSLVPYHRSAERGPTAMRVFLPIQD